MKELDILRRVLKILENTTNDIMSIVKELKSIDTNVDEAYKLSLSKRSKHEIGREDD